MCTQRRTATENTAKQRNGQSNQTANSHKIPAAAGVMTASPSGGLVVMTASPNGGLVVTQKRIWEKGVWNIGFGQDDGFLL